MSVKTAGTALDRQRKARPSLILSGSIDLESLCGEQAFQLFSEKRQRKEGRRGKPHVNDSSHL